MDLKIETLDFQRTEDDLLLEKKEKEVMIKLNFLYSYFVHELISKTKSLDFSNNKAKDDFKNILENLLIQFKTKGSEFIKELLNLNWDIYEKKFIEFGRILSK